MKKKFTVRGLVGVFSKINAAILEFEVMEPNTARFNTVDHGMRELIKSYTFVSLRSLNVVSFLLDKLFPAMFNSELL